MAEPNPKYSFENLFIYEGNKLAYSACDAVIKNKGIFNPLYIFSEEGMGKTHFLSACANYLIQKGERVIFLAPFEFYEILKAGKIEKDCWIIVDDFHEFVKAGEETQKLFMRHFEVLIAKQNQFIFSSLYSMEEFKELLPLLKSRLSGGIEVGIFPPDIKEIYEIIKFKLKNKNIELKEEIIRLIPVEKGINFRMIEGIVNKLVLIYLVKREQISSRDIANVFKRGAYEEILFPELKEEIERSVSKIADKIEEAKIIKDFLDEKIYVWRMKGFEVKRLESLKEETDLEKIKREYDRFVEDIKKLVELQKRYGEIGLTDEEIEKMIFDPDKISEIEKRMKELEEVELVEKEEVKEIIPVVGEFNREAFLFLENLLKEKPGVTLIRSDGKNGITTLLKYGYSILKTSSKSFLDSSSLRFSPEEYRDIEYIFIDNFETVMSVEEIKETLNRALEEWVKGNKKVILGGHGKIYLDFPFKEIVISSPTPDAVEKFVALYSSEKGKLVKNEVVENLSKRKWKDLKTLLTFLEEIFSLPVEEITLSDIQPPTGVEKLDFLKELDLKIDIDEIEELIWEEI